LASSAFLSSLSACRDLIANILPQGFTAALDPLEALATTSWQSMTGGISTPFGEIVNIQKHWDAPIVQKVKESLLLNAQDEYTHARLLASSSPHAGDWLNAALRR
jgi:hypothetical protein